MAVEERSGGVTIPRYFEIFHMLSSAPDGYSFRWRWESVPEEERLEYLQLCARYSGFLGKPRLLKDWWGWFRSTLK